MKKQLYLIVLSFLFNFTVSNSLAAKDTLNLILIDGYTNLPIQNEVVQIILRSKNDKKLDEFNLKSDDNGLINFTYSKSKQLSIYATIKGSKFIEMYRTLLEEELTKNLISFPFYPSRSYEREMLKKEDAKYGKIKYQSIDNQLENEEIEEDNVEEEPYTPAEFLGGSKALQQFIAANVVYPQICIDMNEQGKVYCVFVVETDGFISHVEVIKSPSKELDHEAKRLVRSMPLWKPAAHADGTLGREKCYIPINFTLY